MAGGVATNLISASFEQICSYDPPIARGQRYMNFFGGDEARTGANLILGRRRGIVRGEPPVRAGYTTFRGDYDEIITPVIEAREMSLLVVCRWTVTSRFQNYAVSTQLGPSAADPTRNSVGLSFYVDGNNNNAITFAAGRLNNGAAQGVTSPLPVNTDVTRFAFYAMRVTDTYQQIRDLTRGLVTASTLALPRDPTALAFKIGGGYGGTGTDGRCEIAFVDIVEGAYTDAEEAVMYNWAKPSILARLGVAV